MKITNHNPSNNIIYGFLICFAFCSGGLNYALLSNKLITGNAITIQVAQSDIDKAFSQPVTLVRQGE